MTVAMSLLFASVTATNTGKPFPRLVYSAPLPLGSFDVRREDLKTTRLFDICRVKGAAIFPWRHANQMSEVAVEVGNIVVAGHEADVGHGVFRVVQQAACVVDTQAAHEGGECVAGDLLEKREKVDGVMPCAWAISCMRMGLLKLRCR